MLKGDACFRWGFSAGADDDVDGVSADDEDGFSNLDLNLLLKLEEERGEKPEEEEAASELRWVLKLFLRQVI